MHIFCLDGNTMSNLLKCLIVASSFGFVYADSLTSNSATIRSINKKIHALILTSPL